MDVRDVALSSGAGFIVVLCGTIMRMPGLPKKPAAESITLNENGENHRFVLIVAQKKRGALHNCPAFNWFQHYFSSVILLYISVSITAIIPQRDVMSIPSIEISSANI